MASIIALCVPVFLGGIALAVDMAQMTLARRLMQRQADSGALAAVFAMSQGSNVDDAVAHDIALNPGFTLDTSPVIESGPLTGVAAGDERAVRVALSTTLRLPFSGLFLPQGARISAEATATLIFTGDICAMALESGDTTGITMTGSSIIDLGCAMSTNSVAETAVDTGGSSTVNASPIIASGGIPPSANYAPGTVLVPYAVAQLDPFASIGDPVLTGIAKTMRVSPNRTESFTPGRYSDVDIKGTANLAPGIYYLDRTDFSVNGGAVVNGADVTFVITSSTAAADPGSIGGTRMNGSATLNLTASTSGSYKGILFYQDRRALNDTNPINGNSFSTMRGAIYFPSSTLAFSGNTGMNIDCVQFVARRLEFSGNSTIRNICPNASGSKAIAGYTVRLVE